MPIKVPNDLPAVDTLTKENVFVMTDSRAMTQDIRPLQILLLNLMPTKIDTETQLTRLLGNTPLQIELELLQTSTHRSHVTSQEHMLAFYKTFDAVKDKYYDGLIITGAPVETMEFEDVDYWDELCQIMEWSKSHVHSTFHICWGAQAGLYYHYGIPKVPMEKKLSGVYEHHLDYKTGMLFRGFDDVFYVPHSRYTTTRREDVEKVKDLRIICSSDEAGIFAIKSENDRQIFIMGHSEYDGDTLQKEYFRDKEAGIDPEIPKNYFPGDDDTKDPVVTWRSCANLLYSNWLNYFVYQSTPYDITSIQAEDLAEVTPEKTDLTVTKFGGTSLATSEQFKKAADIVGADEARKIVVVSAPGKRSSKDEKITDLLIRAAGIAGSRGYKDRKGALSEGEGAKIMSQVGARFRDITKGLGIEDRVDIDSEIADIVREYQEGATDAFLISRGEYLCARVFATYTGASLLDAKEVVRFDKDGKLLEDETYENIRAALASFGNTGAGATRPIPEKLVVIPGFYGMDTAGDIVTFPRGGSDITGAIVAAAVRADLYDNWTDVSGIRLADPRIVKAPLGAPIITYQELRELSAMGTEVMHEDVVFPVRKQGIPISIRNTDKPDEPGTMIVKNADHYPSILKMSGITGGKGYASIHITGDRLNEDPGVRNRLTEYLTNCDVSIVNTLTGIDSLNFVVQAKDLKGRVRDVTAGIRDLVPSSDISVTSGLAIVALVSRHMASQPAIGAKVLTALAAKKINARMVDYGMEGISISVGVADSDYEDAVRAIYSEFTKK